MAGLVGVVSLLSVTCLLLLAFFVRGFFLAACLVGAMVAMASWFPGWSWCEVLLSAERNIYHWPQDRCLGVLSGKLYIIM